MQHRVISQAVFFKLGWVQTYNGQNISDLHTKIFALRDTFVSPVTVEGIELIIYSIKND